MTLRIEHEFLLPKLWQLSEKYPDVHFYAHPWRHHLKCKPTCDRGCGLLREKNNIFGCEVCWKKSKADYAVKMYGLHAFDVIVRRGEESLAIELKFLRNPMRGNTKANGEFQRFMGQCLLATIVHQHVIGLCVAEDGALDWNKRSGVGGFKINPIAQGQSPISETMEISTSVESEIKLIIKRIS